MKQRRFHIIIFSTFFALLLWISVNMTGEYQTTISVPVVLENLPHAKALAEPLPPTVAVKVRSTGWHLVGMLLLPDTRYILDIGSVGARRRFLTSEEIAERLRVPQGVRVLGVIPETVSVVLDETIRRTIPVRPVTQLEFRPGYDIVGTIRATPDSVVVVGAESVVKRLEEWRTEPLVLEGLRGGMTTVSELLDTLGYAVAVSPKSISLSFDVQPTAEKTFEGVPIEVNQVPENRIVVLIPPKIDIMIRGGVNQIAGVRETDFTAYIDYRTILLDTTGVLQPVVEGPAAVRIVSRVPDKIRYVVRK